MSDFEETEIEVDQDLGDSFEVTALDEFNLDPEGLYEQAEQLALSEPEQFEGTVSSIGDVVAAAGVSDAERWEKISSSDGRQEDSRLSRDGEDWKYTGAGGEEISLTESIHRQGDAEAAARHDAIKAELNTSGYAVVEYRDENLGANVREAYFADQGGHISYEIFQEKDPVQLSDFETGEAAEFFDGGDEEETVAGGNEGYRDAEIPAVELSLNEAFAAAAEAETIEMANSEAILEAVTTMVAVETAEMLSYDEAPTAEPVAKIESSEADGGFAQEGLTEESLIIDNTPLAPQPAARVAINKFITEHSRREPAEFTATAIGTMGPRPIVEPNAGLDRSGESGITLIEQPAAQPDQELSAEAPSPITLDFEFIPAAETAPTAEQENFAGAYPEQIPYADLPSAVELPIAEAVEETREDLAITLEEVQPAAREPVVIGTILVEEEIAFAAATSSAETPYATAAESSAHQTSSDGATIHAASRAQEVFGISLSKAEETTQALEIATTGGVAEMAAAQQQLIKAIEPIEQLSAQDINTNIEQSITRDAITIEHETAPAAIVARAPAAKATATPNIRTAAATAKAKTAVPEATITRSSGIAFPDRTAGRPAARQAENRAVRTTEIPETRQTPSIQAIARPIQVRARSQRLSTEINSVSTRETLAQRYVPAGAGETAEQTETISPVDNSAGITLAETERVAIAA